MLTFLKKLLVLSPKKLEDNSYSPSPIALKLATVKETDFSNIKYENAYTEKKLKVLMICTEEKNMVMKNGKKFSTGNHPVEMMLPMLHLRNAGFDIDIITPTGKPVQIEMWAMPQNDDAVQNIYKEYKQQFENPSSVTDFVNNSLTENTPYIGVFLPGGHGAMLGLPNNPDVGKIIRWSHKKDLFMLALCHGPAALLAANIDSDNNEFIYKGPGHMPWRFGERLNNLGVTILNKKITGACHIDRKLISGDSPLAANKFGEISATKLLEEVNTNIAAKT